MGHPEQSGIFSRRTVKNRGPMLQIFRADQTSLPEEEQRPSIILELDGEASQCLWTSREPVEQAKAKTSRTIGRKRGLTDWKPVVAGFRVVVDNAVVGYEGDYGQRWTPRFWCNVKEGTLPVKPLSQLIASTVVDRGFNQRDIQGLISDFIHNPEIHSPQ